MIDYVDYGGQLFMYPDFDPGVANENEVDRIQTNLMLQFLTSVCQTISLGKWKAYRYRTGQNVAR